MLLPPSAPGCLSLPLRHVSVVVCGCTVKLCWISWVFLSGSFFSQSHSLAASVGPVLGDGPGKSNQLCTGGAASRERGLVWVKQPYCQT